MGPNDPLSSPAPTLQRRPDGGPEAAGGVSPTLVGVIVGAAFGGLVLWVGVSHALLVLACAALGGALGLLWRAGGQLHLDLRAALVRALTASGEGRR